MVFQSEIDDYQLRFLFPEETMEIILPVGRRVIYPYCLNCNHELPSFNGFTKHNHDKHKKFKHECGQCTNKFQFAADKKIHTDHRRCPRKVVEN